MPAISPERAPRIAQSLLDLRCPSDDYENDYENDYEMTMGQLRTDGMMHSRVPKLSARRYRMLGRQASLLTNLSGIVDEAVGEIL